MNVHLQVKVLYVRNLKSDVTEEQLKEKFEPFGKIERVKKIKDYGFIHFEDRDDAVKAMDELNGTVIEHCWPFVRISLVEKSWRQGIREMFAKYIFVLAENRRVRNGHISSQATLGEKKNGEKTKVAIFIRIGVMC